MTVELGYETRIGTGLYTYNLISHNGPRAGDLLLHKQKWTNIIYTWDIAGHSLKLYIDGKEVPMPEESKDNKTWDGPPAGFDSRKGSIDIGGGSYGAPKDSTRNPKEVLPFPEDFKYTFDEVRIYNKVLTHTEIKELSGINSP